MEEKIELNLSELLNVTEHDDIIIIRSSSHGSTSEMAAAVRYREPDLRPGYSYSDLHSEYQPEEDPEYYCE